MSGYTKGPWTTGPAFVVKAVTKDDLSRTVTNWVAECPKSGVKPIEEAYANARLIAAAPDMHEALKVAEIASEELCQGQDPANECWNTLRMIRAALAKAEGK